MDNAIKPLTVSELKKLKRPLKEYYKHGKENLSFGERMAVIIASRVGTMGFFAIIFTWTVFWLGWNILGPVNMRFDPSPAFVLWLFVSNMIQLFLMPMILISQNIEDKQSQKRLEADLEVNVVAEREIENILLHLENQEEMILKILKRMEDRGM